MSEYYTKEEAEKAVEALGVNMVDSSDHVSKSELRAWCEAIKNNPPQVDYGLTYPVQAIDSAINNVLEIILEKFCAGEK